jgi:xanthosine utilization system XapX-like protein
LLTSGILSGLLIGPQKAIKKWFEHNEQVMILTVAAAGMLVAGAHYLINTPSANPSIIAVQGLVLAFMTQPFYFIVWKPLMRKIGVSFIPWLREQIKEAESLNEVKTAVEPAGGLPAPALTEKPTVPITDFKP